MATYLRKSSAQLHPRELPVVMSSEEGSNVQSTFSHNIFQILFNKIIAIVSKAKDYVELHDQVEVRRVIHNTGQS